MKKTLMEILDKSIFEEEEPFVNSPIDSILGSFKNNEPPISVSRFDWQILQDPERIGKKFTFKKGLGLREFLNLILDYQDYKKHHASLVVEFESIVVETHTHDFQGVTELDHEMAKFCDETFKQIRDHYSQRGESGIES